MSNPIADSIISTALSAAEGAQAPHIRATLAELAAKPELLRSRTFLLSEFPASANTVEPSLLDRVDDALCFLALIKFALEGELIQERHLPDWLNLPPLLESSFSDYYTYVRPNPLVRLLERRVKHGQVRTLVTPNVSFDALYSRLAAFTRQLGKCCVRRVAASLDLRDDGISWDDVFSLLDDPERLARLAIDSLGGKDAVAGEYYLALKDFLAVSADFDVFLREIDDPQVSSACFFVNERWYSFARDRAQAALVIALLRWRDYSREVNVESTSERLDSATAVLEGLRRLTSSHYRFPFEAAPFQFSLFDTNRQVPGQVKKSHLSPRGKLDGSTAASSTLDWKTARDIVEIAVLSAAAPLTTEKLLETLGASIDRRVLYRLLEDLAVSYETRPLQLVEVVSGWRFQTRAHLRPFVENLRSDKPPKYSRAVMETLAIVAYRQPVTRGDIEDIRGVTVSGEVMRQLEERDWIEVIGHREAVGRPGLYATTRRLLDDLGLQSLDQLPSLDGIFPSDEAVDDFVSPLANTSIADSRSAAVIRRTSAKRKLAA